MSGRLLLLRLFFLLLVLILEYYLLLVLVLSRKQMLIIISLDYSLGFIWSLRYSLREWSLERICVYWLLHKIIRLLWGISHWDRRGNLGLL